MTRIRVDITGLGKNFAKIQAQTIARLSERQIEEIARQTERVIKQKISERIKRDDSTGNLANSFTTVKLADGWGVGDISFLNNNAPYWYWQNFGVAQSGRRTPPADYGYFPSGMPRQGGGSERWIHTGSPDNFLMVPGKPIEAKNYIQATLNEVNQIITSVIGRIKI